jgi:hypothetical protein
MLPDISIFIIYWSPVKNDHPDDFLRIESDTSEVWRKQHQIRSITDATPSRRSCRGAVPDDFQIVYVNTLAKVEQGRIAG